MCEIGDMSLLRSLYIFVVALSINMTLLTELRIRNVTRLFYETASVGKILDKSRPPERCWRYPKSQLFPEHSIVYQNPDAMSILIPIDIMLKRVT